MSAKRKGLGRGLDALLGISAAEHEHQDSSAAAGPVSEDGTLKHLPIEFLQRGKYQPRRDMHPEALQELAESIRSQGIMQPIVVRPLGPDSYEIIAGERRWRAAQMAGLDKVPTLVRDVPDQAAIAMALIENIQREDLNPIEEAHALTRLQQEFHLTQQQVAEAVGKSRAAVANLMRLLALENEVRIMLERGDIEMGHARALLGLSGDEQTNAARTVAGKGLTVRQTEELVRRLIKAKDEQPRAPIHADPDIRRLEQRVAEHVGLPVAIQHGAGGKGKVVFSYSRLDELDGLLERLKVGE
ncbi:MAG: ParB/RepB/Spo0J family partition protein [Pseudomonadota bacterium]|jgi:ParB family chromosome partitioning protein|nr:ParB/RepB/Spo0J family partition protein [Pseudomonadota bacterium]